MTSELENPRNHEPALSREHDAGVAQSRQSPAERALAPEGDAPFQSANAASDGGTYVGQGGGYAGGDGVPADADETRGEGTYGYPSGPGVGEPGGEHQPGRTSIEAEELQRAPRP